MVTQSRAYDQVFDATYTGPSMVSDPRVAVANSQQGTVAGAGRFKYFRRPIMPRMSSVPPQVLLAPTEAIDPLAPVEQEVEAAVKEQGMQTMYRESEAQTNPYTPDFFVAEGTEPEVLLLKDMKYEDGLPVGRKEVQMIEQARAKKELESCLPPFTDEACLNLRKRLMEAQEMKEFKMREGEIDALREARLEAIEMALRDRDESNEFLASQRVEGIRQIRIEEREKTLLKIRDKRIKVLRRLAHRRNQIDPRLSSSGGPDPISFYFDKGSKTYAPIKRMGVLVQADASQFDAMSRTAPLNTMDNIAQLEGTISHKTMGTSAAKIDMMAQTMPTKKKGPRAAEPRLTSAALRSLRNRKRDIEVMTRMLTLRKLERTGAIRPDSQPAAMSGAAKSGKAKGRPPSPDYTQQAPDVQESSVALQTAVVLLQRLLRGRAVQNTMFEGRYRRRELIVELRATDEAVAFAEANAEEMERMKNEEMTQKQSDDVKSSTVDAVAGAVSSNLMYGLVQEKTRNDEMVQLQSKTEAMFAQRRTLEAEEGGRRQKEDRTVPIAVIDDEMYAGIEDGSILADAEVRKDRFLEDPRFQKKEEPVGGDDDTGAAAE